MKITEMLKRRNRTLLELDMGLLFWTMAATAAGVLLPLGEWGLARMAYLSGVWTAAVLVAAAFIHMNRCLELALDQDAKTATKLIYQGYLLRYVGLGLIAVITTLLHLLNPVVLCLAYLLLMKVAAYSQPFTHKICNKLFHETDPVPEPLSEGELQENQDS